MMEQSPPSHLELPQKSVELEDSGAQESAPNSDEEDHFSDATEGNEYSHSRTESGHVSPIPRTRVEKVDDNPSHGDVPGTTAYDKRGEDSVPDEVEVIPEGSRSRSQSVVESRNHSQDSGESSVPRTVVERVEPERPSHGDVPGTFAYDQRRADAVPDVVKTAPESGGTSESGQESSDDDTANTAVPETVVSQVETPSDEKVEPKLHAHRRRPSDAVPDVTETVPDAPDPQHSLDTSPDILAKEEDQEMTGTHDGQEAPMDDDFDDFAEGQEDDFGDFDDGFQGPSEDVTEESTTTPPQQSPGLSVPPLLDFDTIETLSDISSALETPLDQLFPGSKDTTSLPPIEPIDNASAIFHTDRSISLWSQLVAPPPLQPQNWVKSRIRRLFLVSLGVPVDLDEILPASKQKKLVLPSIDLGPEAGQQRGHGSKYGTATSQDSSAVDPNTATSSPSTAQPHHHQQQNQQQQPPSSSSTSASASASASASSYSRRRLPTPPPDLDLSAVSRLYATTDAALSNLTDLELRAHIAELQQTTQRATTVVEYWVKRLDGLVGEKEAFEGVIENLVSHARRVRK